MEIIFACISGAAIAYIVALYRINALKNSAVVVEAENKNLNEKIAVIELQNNSLLLDKERLTAENGSLKNASSRVPELEKVNSELAQKNTALTAEVSSVKTALENEKNATVEKLKQLEASKEKMTESFKVLAHEILNKQSKEFSQSSSEKLGSILQPLAIKIKEFEQKVQNSHEHGIKQHASLKTEIDKLQQLNRRISEEAVNLTKALKGESKTQGCWGEMILERILETAGLQRDINYKVEESINTKEGKRFRPDVIVNLPEQKQLIIDSKVSITSYERSCSTDDKVVRDVAIKEHVNSLRNHIKELSNKNYHQLPGITSVDMVLMFIPIEPALGLALQAAPDLFEEAMHRNIVIVTPSTLLATMRTVAFILRQDKQAKNAKNIADDAGKLYDKLVAFATDLEKVGSQLKTVNKTYDAAINKFSHGRGNVLKRAEDIKKLGINTSKKFSDNLLDAVEDSQPLLIDEDK